MRVIAAVLLALVGLLGCGERARPRCSEVCTREAECMRAHDPEAVWDTGECADACGQLERSGQTLRAVEAHLSCVEQATGCEQILECR
jgi:hypothetical protein